jgi:threonine dehydrogenase-like Zn-dependent dehydrogenase
MLEFLAIGAHAVRRGQVQPGERVLVAGAGPIGMAALIFARLRGAIPTVLDMRRDRLDFCVQHLAVAAAVQIGADIEHAERAAARDLARLTGGDWFDVVFDATGNPAAMARGFQYIAHGGRYVLVSVVRGDITFSDPEFHKREATLLGSRNATLEDFDTVLAAMRAGQVPDAALNTHRIALRDVVRDFPGLLDPARHVVKALVEC